MVLIIGGGITGLAAAFELTGRGVPFVLLEASDRLGGLIRTERMNGFTIDTGADSMLVQKPAALQLCDELGLTARLMASTPPRTAFVHARGQLHVLPFPSVFGIPTTWTGVAGYDLLPWPARLRLGAGLSSTPASAAADESVAAFFRRRYGDATVDLIAQPLLGGIHAGDVGSLSIASVAPRLVEADAKGLRRGRRPDAGGDGLFRSLRDGMGELVETLERRLPAESIRRRSAVTTVTRDRSAWQVTSTAGAFAASAVIVAAPAHAAARMLSPIDDELARLCAEVPYASTVSVALAFRRAAVTHPLDGSGFVVARRHSTLQITACSWVSSKWEGRAPQDVVLLRAFLGSIADPEVVRQSDAALIAAATRDLRDVLGLSGTPLLARVHRWIDAGAQHNVGHLARLAHVEARLALLPGLFVAGSGFRSIGVPDCIADGRAAAIAAARSVQPR